MDKIYLSAVCILVFGAKLVHMEAPLNDDVVVTYQCEKYCHMQCSDISIGDHDHREQCELVHSHESNCHCHFGGTYVGIFVAIGVVSLVLISCCFWRLCRTHMNRPEVLQSGPIPQQIYTIEPSAVIVHPVVHHDQNSNILYVASQVAPRSEKNPEPEIFPGDHEDTRRLWNSKYS